MHRFTLWAPKAKTVEVKTGGTRHPLAPIGGGWSEAIVDDAGPGTDYSYFLDGEDLALPDPRSLWQPYGVHGASRVFDQTAFRWSDAGWQAPALKDAVFYEVHIGTFTPEGTFDAACGHLEYLKSLGITHVEVMPVASFPGKHGWGYDGVDLFAPHEPYGGPEALKRFVDACHAHGLAVVLDVVYNHLGPSGNYLSRFGPYFTSVHHTPWGDAVNLEDGGSYEVRRFFCDNALMWLRDYHFDGLRLDAVHAYLDRSAIHFMEQMASEVDALRKETGREYALIAESDLNDPRVVTSRETNGYGMDAQWSDDFHHALVSLLTGDHSGYYADFGTIADLAKSLRRVFVYDGRYSKYRDRIHGRAVEGLPAWRFLGYAQNHDQVGNRAKGERLIHLTNVGRAKIAAALVLTSPFVPMLFQGEEWGASSPFLYFTDHEDQELGRLVSEGRKKEFAAFGWSPDEVPDPQAEETFERSRLKWDEESRAPHAELLEWHRALITFRKSMPELIDGRLDETQLTYSEDEQWLCVRRGRVYLAFALAKHGVDIELPANAVFALRSDAEITLNQGRLHLSQDSVAVVIDRNDGWLSDTAS
jgi:maltooligosyltrehalose trehalohydrolase